MTNDHDTPALEPVHSSDYTVPRSDISTAPEHAVHQTRYTAEHCTLADYLPADNGMLSTTTGSVVAPADLHRADGNEVNWLHFVGLNNAALLKAALAPYNIHELVLEDILSQKQRPKIEDYGSYLFIAARVYQYSGGKLQSDQVYLIVGSDFVLTFQQRPLGLFSSIRQHMSDPRYDIRNQDAAFLAYRIIDRLIDDYFLTLDQFNNRVEAIDKTLFADTADNSGLLTRIHRLKRDAVRLRRTLQPLRDVLAQLVHGEFTAFHGKSHLYLRDAYDHTMQLLESLDASRDMVVSMMDIHLSFQSNRLNQQMRVLTVITILFMPLTVITGIYGMNFDNMPELHWHYGYFMVLGLMALIIISLLAVFHRRKWL
ncbi:magnesium/cobalt transporter CorA [Uruburuella testudinis]|uniref:Magnesium transport protein CorA n=1 Tax=Uruburuella testudinis TaxID=1282863 RepID=A0ABY4DVC5_9NEIS|nr:magnesium/cobalt transporter CorA [Uruburuella testudinis]UOO82982.1 magnesium/cobalt transporter CorA [Uruburuella testudinis]